MSEFGDGGPAVEPLGAWRTLVRNFSALAAGEAVARLLGFVAILLLARRLEPAGFGLVTLGVTLVVWFSLVVDSGTEVLKTRDIAREPHRLREIAEPVLGLRLALSGAAMAIFALAALIGTKHSGDRVLLWLFALVLPCKALNLRWMVLGVRASKAVAAGNIAAQLLFVTGVVLLVRNRHDIRTVPVLQAGGELVYALVILGAVSRRAGVLRPRVDLASWLATLRASFPLFVNAASRAIVYSASIVVIAVFLTRSDVGYYGAAFRPILLCLGVMGLFYISFLSSYSGADSDHRPLLLSRTLRLAALATFPAAAILSASAGFVVPLVYGEAYAPAAATLAVVSWMIPALALAGPYANVLIAADRQRRLMRNNLAAAAFSIVATVAAVPLVGMEGAAAVAVAAQFLVLVLNYRSAVALDLAPPLGTIIRPRARSAPEVSR